MAMVEALTCEEHLWFSGLALPWPSRTRQLHTDTPCVWYKLAGRGGGSITHRARHCFLLYSTSMHKWTSVGTTKGHPGEEKDPRVDNPAAETHLHKNGSMLISTQEQGMVSSNLVITSGWRTPSFPMLWPRAKISAHRPGKNAEPERQREKNQCFSRQKCQ